MSVPCLSLVLSACCVNCVCLCRCPEIWATLWGQLYTSLATWLSGVARPLASLPSGPRLSPRLISLIGNSPATHSGLSRTCGNRQVLQTTPFSLLYCCRPGLGLRTRGQPLSQAVADSPGSCVCQFLLEAAHPWHHTCALLAYGAFADMVTSTRTPDPPSG